MMVLRGRSFALIPRVRELAVTLVPTMHPETAGSGGCAPEPQLDLTLTTRPSMRE